MSLLEELDALLKKYATDKSTDAILARYIKQSVAAFSLAILDRDKYYAASTRESAEPQPAAINQPKTVRHH